MPQEAFALDHARLWRTVSARRVLAALIVGLALVVTACGGSQTGGAPTPTPTHAASPTATPTPPCASWRVVPSPNGTRYRDNRLLAVSALTPADAWAVGMHFSEGGTTGPQTTLVERWDGSAWQVVTSPGDGGHLAGVAAVSATDAWAVGLQYTMQGDQLRTVTLIEHWNGATWSQVTSPDPSAAGNALNGVAAVAANDVWAVGNYNSAGALLPLIERWDGATWRVVTGPALPGVTQSDLASVARIPGSHQLWAVGYTLKGPRPAYEQPLIERWDGTAWHVVTGPALPSGSFGGQLDGVVALSTTDAWAVGDYAASNRTRQPLIARWNGATWEIVPGAIPSGADGGFLSAVAAAGPRDVRAVGGSFTGDAGRSQAMLAQWDGTAWHVAESPAPSGASYQTLDGVVADSAGSYWAVGSYGTAAGREQTLALHCP